MSDEPIIVGVQQKDVPFSVMKDRMDAAVNDYLNAPNLTPEERAQRIITLAGCYGGRMVECLYICGFQTEGRIREQVEIVIEKALPQIAESLEKRMKAIRDRQGQ